MSIIFNLEDGLVAHSSLTMKKGTEGEELETGESLFIWVQNGRCRPKARDKDGGGTVAKVVDTTQMFGVTNRSFAIHVVQMYLLLALIASTCTIRSRNPDD
ncbi:Uncharacterized protein Fot_18845 [Forsythia ovata]|uniref:Uncharacterized protein n=1 Tax=Forsythia ovata TaxID=205694 RepID=A0ABD1VJF0_9LAMI